MSFLRTVLGWAGTAWNAIFGAISSPVQALEQLWHFITSVHSLVSWLFGSPLLTYALNALTYLNAWHDGAIAIRDALHRLATWIYATWIRPAVVMLLGRIAELRQWTFIQLLTLTLTVWRLYNRAIWYAHKLVAAEHAAMTSAVAREHAAMLAGDKATLQMVQKQAATGYNATRRDRAGLLGQLAEDLAGREPALKAIIPRLVGYILDLETIDDPVLRWIVQHLVAEVLAKSGADHLMGDLLGTLLGTLAGGGPPSTLAGVEHDVGARLNDLEAQWASFMHHGGPEVESAGDQWRELTGVVADAAVLAFFAQAVADPQAWAAEVSGTVGAVTTAARDGIMALIGRP